MNNQSKPFIHGGFIILFTFIFFPVAIVLFITRLIKHKNNLYLKMLDSVFLSRIFMFLFVIVSISYLGQWASGEASFGTYLIYILLFLVPSLHFRRKAKKFKKLYEEQFAAYYEPEWEPVAPITHNVQVNTHIYNAPVSAAPVPPAKKLPPRSVNCTGCSAPIVLKPDEAKECEYCGTYMTYS